MAAPADAFVGGGAFDAPFSEFHLRTHCPRKASRGRLSASSTSQWSRSPV